MADRKSRITWPDRQGGTAPAWLPVYRILMVWVYDRTESQLVVTLMHVLLIAMTGILAPLLSGEKLLIFLLAKAAIFWLFVAAVFLRRRSERKKASV